MGKNIKYVKFANKDFIKYVKNIETIGHGSNCRDCPLRGIPDLKNPQYQFSSATGNFGIFFPDNFKRMIKNHEELTRHGASDCLMAYIFVMLIAGFEIDEGVENYNDGNYGSCWCECTHKYWGELKKRILLNCNKDKFDIS